MAEAINCDTATRTTDRNAFSSTGSFDCNVKILQDLIQHRQQALPDPGELNTSCTRINKAQSKCGLKIFDRPPRADCNG